MDFLHILAIALALAVDAFAVAVAAGIHLKSLGGRQLFRLSWHFGLFQAGMTAMGWVGGISVRHALEGWDHWIALILLLLVGGNMLLSAIRERDADDTPASDPTKGVRLIMLSVATSLDALAVGFSLSILVLDIALPAIIIGMVATACTLVGMVCGARIGQMDRIGRYAEAVGGCILILIGVRIFMS